MGFYGWFLVGVRLAGLFAALAAAGFWFSASAGGVPDNLDAVMPARR